MYKHIDSFKIVFYLCLKFCTAFHCVSHEILLSKLNIYGMLEITLDWLYRPRIQYITNETNYICMNNENSNRKTIHFVVPQGYILGPLPFLIFINDITKCSNQFKYILYADDSTLTTCIPDDNVMDSAELINTGLECYNRLIKSNKFSIKADKTKHILFSCY